MRLVILSESFYPLGGGVGTYGLALSRHLVERGAEVTVVTRRQLPDLNPRDIIDGVEIIRLPPSGFRRVGKYLTLPAVFGWLIRHRKEYDAIYVWGLRILGPVAVLAGKIAGKPVALRAEQTGEISGSFVWQDQRARTSVSARVVRAALGARDAILRKADRFVAISAEIAEEFRQTGFPADRLVRIPNGVDLASFHPGPRSSAPASRESLGLPRNAFLFLYTGRLHRHKGLLTLLEAWRHVATGEKRAHLVLVGENSPNLGIESELRNYVTSHLLSDSVTFAGKRASVLPYLQVADAFVLPSQREGLSIALLEAMACELPAIGTRTSGTVELIREGENGYLVEIGDAEGIRRAMMALLADPAKARAMGLAGRQMVEREYRLDLAAARHLQLLSELAGTMLPGDARDLIAQAGH